MYRELTEAKLKSGEHLEIGVVMGPDGEYANKITPFLGHKPGEFKWHIERSVKEKLDDLETYYYIGKLGDEIVANIMTVEHIGVGILGHVFTKPEHRRKGACTVVMREQMDDFRRRNGRALYLGTGYDSPPYHIYKGLGFVGFIPGSGFMRYFVDSSFESEWFTSTEAKVKDVEWHDWPKMTALTGILGGDWLRCVMLPMYGPTNFEGGFLGLKMELENDRKYQAFKLLESETGAIVGFGSLADDRRWHGNTALLDLFVHPDHWGSGGKLMEALDLPSKKIQCYADPSSVEKISLLERFGFERETVLKRQIVKGDEELDIFCYCLLP
jgi:RimJ/RimL family protein N-acetyltransferase